MDINTKAARYLISLSNQKISYINNDENKAMKAKSIYKRDILEVTNEGKQLLKHKSTVSREEKIKNRERIDFVDGVVTFDFQSRLFTLPDGSKISADDVATSVDYNKVSNFKVEDNKLILKQGQYYNFTDENGNANLYGSAKVLSSHSFVDYCLDDERRNQSQPMESFKPADILGSLMEYKTPMGAYLFYSHDEVNNLLEHLGFKPGKIQIGIEGSFKSTYFLTHDGELYGEYESEARINSINSRNHLEYSVPPDSIWRIDGKEYPMDEKGYFQIPSGIMCVPGEMELVDSNGNLVQIKSK